MSIKNGLYKVQFETPLGVGFGVVVLENGVVRGGDSALFYTGNYSSPDGKFSAVVKTERHANLPEVQSVFGIDRVTINLKGDVVGDTVNVDGTAQEVPGVSFRAKLAKIAA